jgi:hypothetical protein
MFVNPNYRSVVRLTIAVLLVTAASCTVHIVSDYDDQIDSGLSQLNTDTTAFVTKMTAAAGTPAGTYDQNKQFYIIEEAKIDTLVARSEAHKALNSCPSTQLVSSALSAAVPSSDVAKYADKIPKDDCSVVLLQLVKQGFVDLETFHKEQASAGIPASAKDPILVGGVGALIRAAMTVEIAKKTGGSIGRKNGP